MLYLVGLERTLEEKIKKALGSESITIIIYPKNWRLVAPGDYRVHTINAEFGLFWAGINYLHTSGVTSTGFNLRIRLM